MTRRSVGAGLLAAAWVGIAVLVLERVAPSPGWDGPRVLGVSCWFLIYRIVVWGLAPALLAPKLSLFRMGLVAFGVELALSGEARVAGTLVGLALAFLPAQLFSRWTRESSHLRERVALHFAYYTVLMLWVVPAVAFDLSGGSMELGPWSQLDKVLVQLVVLPGVLGIAATMEFRDRGKGTPMPYDPPLTLVVTGPFAYVANPFQISKVLLMLGWGLFLGSRSVVVIGGIIFLYGITLTRRNEDRELPRRFGRAWDDYRANVRRWIPRWRPYRNRALSPAVFYFDGGCAQCSQLASFLNGASHLELVPGDSGISRMTYDPRDGGNVEHGVTALARALEHVHLGWAFVAWSMRVPFLSSLFELVANVVTRAPEPAPCQSTMTVSVGERMS